MAYKNVAGSRTWALLAACLAYATYAAAFLTESEDGEAGWVIFGLPVLLLIAGAAWGRWRAVVYVGLAPLLTLAAAADAAWVLGIWDRTDEYESLPTLMYLTPLAVICARFVTFGVTARKV